MQLSFTFQLMQAQIEGKAMAALMAFHSTSWTKWDEISLGYNYFQYSHYTYYNFEIIC